MASTSRRSVAIEREQALYEYETTEGVLHLEGNTSQDQWDGVGPRQRRDESTLPFYHLFLISSSYLLFITIISYLLLIALSAGDVHTSEAREQPLAYAECMQHWRLGPAIATSRAPSLSLSLSESRPEGRSGRGSQCASPPNVHMQSCTRPCPAGPAGTNFPRSYMRAAAAASGVSASLPGGHR